jgi:serine/threonine protein kinase
MFREGETIAGKYRVERTLGQGGMGVVVAAHHLDLQQNVAIKFLRPELMGGDEALKRFLREARAAVRIQNEHVARVLDVGALDSGVPYIVMEYLDGVDLAAWLEKQGPVPARQAVDFVLQACEALAEAHSLGIVHRDLKPANLFCIRRPDGALFVKVLDFGISKILDGAGASAITQTASFVGSPLYMCPEQMAGGGDVDARADIWALGAILYEFVTRRRPFVASSMPELFMKIAREPAARWSDLDIEAPPGLEAVVRCCLEKDRERRYPSVADLAIDLAPFGPPSAAPSVQRIVAIVRNAGARREPVSGPANAPPTDTLANPSTASNWDRPSPRLRSPRLAIGVGVAAAILVAGAGFAVAVHGQAAAAASSTPVAVAAPAAAPARMPPALETAPGPIPPEATVTPPVTASAVAASLPPVAPVSAAAHGPHGHRPRPSEPLPSVSPPAMSTAPPPVSPPAAAPAPTPTPVPTPPPNPTSLIEDRR